MRVKIIKNYYDTTKNNKLILAGAVLTVPAKRGIVLVKAGVAEEIKDKED